MQSQQPPAPAPATSSDAPRAARQTNNDAGLLSRPRQRLSLHTAPKTPLPLSLPLSPRRTPSSPSLGPLALRRSPSVASKRSSSPALGRKSSASSMRGDMPGTPRGATSRRSSFAPMPSPMGPNSPLQPPPVEKLPLRACDVAADYFSTELAGHESQYGHGGGAGTVVIVHDQCYGHRYARPKTPKSTLSLIMERPERILASVLGISAAYVRLGERHAAGSHPPRPYHSPPERVPFAIRKTARLVDLTSQAVTNVHGTKWMAELKSLCDDAERKLTSTGKELARDTPLIPGQAPKKELHSGDLYLCPESLNAFQGALGGVLDAVDAIFQGTSAVDSPSRAFVCVRPPGHHCSDDYPSGFCWVNNVHVGIEHAMMNYGLTHAAIIDFDLHHGDGSQAITWARNKKVQNMSKNTPNWKKTSIGYFSLHDINSYPCEDGDDDKVQAASLCIDNAHGQSVWNVHLQSWKTSEQFWAIYEDRYLVLLEKTRLYLKSHTHRLRTTANHPAPKAAIFLSAGFDASEWETAGMQRHSVNVPTEFYARFTRDVVRLAEEEGTGVHGRVISVLEGGYSDRALTSGVLSHLSGLCDGQVWTEPRLSKGLAFDTRQRLGGLNLSDEDVPMPSVEAEPTLVSYDPLWWHPTQLSELESLVSPPPTMAPKKPRTGPATHFSSPTQSFTAKVVDPSKLSRSQSGRYTATPSRAPTPPPPDVDWATAAHALSKLLIPPDRQTRSHRAEELAELKVRKEKAAVPALSSVQMDGSGRQLRGRKAVGSYVDASLDNELGSLRAESRASRRQTIADFPLATSQPFVPTRAVSRRVSIASSVSSIGDRSVSRAPSAAMSRRSVAPASTPANSIPVKKTRAPAATIASRAPQRPAVVRMPSNLASKGVAAKGKENDDVDMLAAGLKRITLKMPSKEEYETREKEREERQRAAEMTKKAPAKSTGRKAPAVRPATSKATAKPVTVKKGPGRPTKSSKPPSPLQRKVRSPVPESPRVQSVAEAGLGQPQAKQAEPPLKLFQSGPQEAQVLARLPACDGRTSGSVELATELRDMVVTAEQLREQLPMPSFVTVTAPVSPRSLPRGADIPPPPPPSSVAQFVNYTSHTFGTASTSSMPGHEPEVPSPAPLQWLPAKTNLGSDSRQDEVSLLPMGKRADLPVFSANGAIPFASKPSDAESRKQDELQDSADTAD